MDFDDDKSSVYSRSYLLPRLNPKLIPSEVPNEIFNLTDVIHQTEQIPEILNRTSSIIETYNQDCKRDRF